MSPQISLVARTADEDKSMKGDDGFLASLENQEYLDQILLTLKIVPLFIKFTQTELELVVRSARHVYYDPGEAIFDEGAVERSMHVVLSGSVVLFKIDEETGDEAIVATRRQDSVFGEIAFVTGEPRNTAARAGEKGSEHLIFEASAFEEVAREDPDLTFKMFSSVLESINERLGDLPLNFRNYVVWGIRAEGLERKATPFDPMTILLVTAAGVGLGALGGNQLSQWALERYPILVKLPAITGALPRVAGLLGGFLGLAAGWGAALASRLPDRSSGIGPRACMNCRFVTWTRRGAEHACLYQKLEFQRKVIPGKTYDSTTECPAFQYRDIARSPV